MKIIWGDLCLNPMKMVWGKVVEDVVDARVEALLVAPAVDVLVAEEVRVEACVEDVVADVLAEIAEVAIKQNIYNLNYKYYYFLVLLYNAWRI